VARRQCRLRAVSATGCVLHRLWLMFAGDAAGVHERRRNLAGRGFNLRRLSVSAVVFGEVSVRTITRWPRRFHRGHIRRERRPSPLGKLQRGWRRDSFVDLVGLGSRRAQGRPVGRMRGARPHVSYFVSRRRGRRAWPRSVLLYGCSDAHAAGDLLPWR
jgi:hypothetical protein